MKKKSIPIGRPSVLRHTNAHNILKLLRECGSCSRADLVRASSLSAPTVTNVMTGSVVNVTNPICGDELRLAVRIENGRIAAARFHTRGCKAAIASASLLTELIVGKTIEEIRDVTAEQISQALGGLPAATRHGSQLAEDALDEILEQL